MIISSHIDQDESEDPQEESFFESVATEASVEIRSLLVQTAFHGQRLDKMLAASVPEFSRSYLQQLLEDGAVTRLGLVCTKSATKVKVGESWTFELRATPQSQAFKPENNKSIMGKQFGIFHLYLIFQIKFKLSKKVSS